MTAAEVPAAPHSGRGDELCDNRGPRIGSEGCPRCRLPKGHDGNHRPAPEDGWGSIEWSNWKVDELPDPTEPPATAEQLRDLILENERLRAVEGRVRDVVAFCEEAQIGMAPGRAAVYADVVGRLRRALGDS